MVTKTFSPAQEEKILEESRDFITSWCKDNNVSTKTSSKIAICADEITSNVCFYSHSSFLEISCDINNDIITIVYADDGTAFNPLTEAEQPDISQSLEERKIGGLGIFMVKNLCQSVDYKYQNNKNTLIMKIKNDA